MFPTLLIANRGEIACRIIRTARRMGIRTIAVCSEADQGAPHAMLADAAYTIGPAPARDSYLSIDAILGAARASGAQAVHPGYGFLSENAAFAEACAAAGLVFVGPPPAAIRAMGSKSEAKALMQAAGVPLVPGYHGANQDPALLATEAALIGYPVLIKASAGGGGKGMRIVQHADEFAEALAVAKGEAASSFGDDRVLVERYLTQPRHIEIQVFADRHGHTISLFERDCSIQRRHQKVLEEAPAPGMDATQRARMGDAACAAARAVGYVGAGTVEFITEGAGEFFFMEMNTRLQVEHPVTEMITGLDLVEWQLRVAAGEPLPPAPDAPRGHAIEVRLYAEDPDRDFMPATGTIAHLRFPPPGPHVRVDSGIAEGETVGVHYDPMLAKVIVWDETRAQAVQRLQEALAQTALVGLRTNLDLLRRIAAHPAFGAADLDTGFIARHALALLPSSHAPPQEVVFAAAAAVAESWATLFPPKEADAHSPWAARTGWRLGGAAPQSFRLHAGEHQYDLTAQAVAHGWRITCGDAGAVAAQGMIDGVRHGLSVVWQGGGLTIVSGGQNFAFTQADPLAPAPVAAIAADRLRAPMPGRVIEVRVSPGDTVETGDVVMVLEAMKVQMRLLAPRAGIVGTVCVQAGDVVKDQAELVLFGGDVTTA